VKPTFRVATLVVCLHLVCASAPGQVQNRQFGAAPQGAAGPGLDAAAQRPPVPSGRAATPVAVIDLLYIFENHPGFQEQKARMDRAKEQKEQELLGKRDALKAKAEKFKAMDLKPGTEQYSQYETELAQDEAKLQIDLKKANQDFIIAEGKMYYQTYQEVLDIVKWYAGQYNIGVVLRYTGKQVNPDNPEEIMKEMNEQVVYFNDAVNITGDILKQIQSRYPARVGNAPPRGQRPIPR
jgi:Skp family chaperone for outer membrane proteins